MPNCDLAVADYKDALVAWLRSPPAVELIVKVGATFASDIRSVTPGAFLAARQLLEQLVTSGLRNSVMQAPKFAAALRCVLIANPIWKGSAELDELVMKTTTHMQTLFRLLRECKWEDTECEGPRIFPRSGGFRRRMARAGVSASLETFLELIGCVDDVHHRLASPGLPPALSPAASPSVASTTPYPVSPHEDWPHVFAPPNDVDPIVVEWPRVFMPPSAEKDEFPKETQPITPMGGKRKRQARARSRTTPANIADTIGSHAALMLGCSKCRYAANGCGVCKNPNFGGQRGRAP